MDTVRVTRCESDASLTTASALFDTYRQHYGQPAEPDRARDWLTEVAASGALSVFTASVGGAEPAGLATTHAVPASLAMGEFWQLRDLYVLPGARGRGVATALVTAVGAAARQAGATRLSLVTEVDNHAALGLYGRLGFEPVEGLTSLSLDLR